jgi:hypothetical protein
VTNTRPDPDPRRFSLSDDQIADARRAAAEREAGCRRAGRPKVPGVPTARSAEPPTTRSRSRDSGGGDCLPRLAPERPDPPRTRTTPGEEKDNGLRGARLLLPPVAGRAGPALQRSLLEALRLPPAPPLGAPRFVGPERRSREQMVAAARARRERLGQLDDEAHAARRRRLEQEARDREERAQRERERAARIPTVTVENIEDVVHRHTWTVRRCLRVLRKHHAAPGGELRARVITAATRRPGVPADELMQSLAWELETEDTGQGTDVPRYHAGHVPLRPRRHPRP